MARVQQERVSLPSHHACVTGLTCRAAAAAAQIESPHPYLDNVTRYWEVAEEGAVAYNVWFDPRVRVCVCVCVSAASIVLCASLAACVCAALPLE
jgi:hypothetical protein